METVDINRKRGAQRAAATRRAHSRVTTDLNDATCICSVSGETYELLAASLPTPPTPPTSLQAGPDHPQIASGGPVLGSTSLYCLYFALLASTTLYYLPYSTAWPYLALLHSTIDLLGSTTLYHVSIWLYMTVPWLYLTTNLYYGCT